MKKNLVNIKNGAKSSRAKLSCFGRVVCSLSLSRDEITGMMGEANGESRFSHVFLGGTFLLLCIKICAFLCAQINTLYPQS